MGRIKSTLIKRTAKTLELEAKFSEDFDYNKLVLSDTMPSKSVRNKVAGQITRIVRRKNKEKLELEKPVETSNKKVNTEKEKDDYRKKDDYRTQQHRKRKER